MESKVFPRLKLMFVLNLILKTQLLTKVKWIMVFQYTKQYCGTFQNYLECVYKLFLIDENMISLHKAYLKEH